ncbi:MAG: hypothetical protein ACI3ZQ_09615 [Candidatus Cryptobacteroides sp.]
MASILKKASRHFQNDGTTQSMASLRTAIETLSRDNNFIEEVLDSFSIDKEHNSVIQVGNVKTLLKDIEELDSMATKIDVRIKKKDIYLEHMLEDEKAVFMLYGISDLSLLKELGRDNLLVETRYSAKSDVLEINHLSKFANRCRDEHWDDLLEYIQDYIARNTSNEEYCSARLIRLKDEEQYLLRAVTSDAAYKNYGINFSILVALLSVNQYITETKDNVYIDEYHIDDSTVYLSFQLGNPRKVSDNLELSFNLILENDEIKDSAVRFNGVFKLTYKAGDKSSYLLLRPKSFKDSDTLSYRSDMLTYTHAMNVGTVYEKMKKLPFYISQYVAQTIENANAIIDIKNPREVKDFITEKVRRARDEHFTKYKGEVLARLTALQVNSIFDLFEALGNIEELFGDDIMSKDYWRFKLYELLLYRGKDSSRK